MPLHKKNILVTGGAGFIGSHLIEKLVSDANVICVDDFVSSSERNIDHLLRLENFNLIRHDISKPLDLEAYPELDSFKIKFFGVQEIYHLACPTSVKDFDTHVMATLFANSVGLINILELAKKYKAKFLQASSSVIYGARSKQYPFFDENFRGILDHLTPRGCYDEGKRFAEAAAITYAQAFDLDIKIARIFRTYGPRMKLYDGQMIPDFIMNALEGHDLVIYGDETFRTSLVYVDDMVDGLIKIMAAPKGLGPVNLGSDVDLKLVDVAKKIIELTGSTSKIVFQPRLLFMTELGLPNISKARDTMGWLPLVRLEDGLKKTVEYTKANRYLLNSV
ncbi:MAG: NAD-dependent epimerase/dehydratase family protein [bacterium]